MIYKIFRIFFITRIAFNNTFFYLTFDRRLRTRAKKHLNLGSLVKNKIKEHIIKYNSCSKKDMDSLMNYFVVIKKCLSDYDCTIHEALLIKKNKPKLNKLPLFLN